MDQLEITVLSEIRWISSVAFESKRQIWRRRRNIFILCNVFAKNVITSRENRKGKLHTSRNKYYTILDEIVTGWRSPISTVFDAVRKENIWRNLSAAHKDAINIIKQNMASVWAGGCAVCVCGVRVHRYHIWIMQQSLSYLHIHFCGDDMNRIFSILSDVYTNACRHRSHCHNTNAAADKLFSTASAFSFAITQRKVNLTQFRPGRQRRWQICLLAFHGMKPYWIHRE